MQEESITNLWKLYQKGIEYQSSIGLRTNIPKFVDFFEGRQWPSATENTKNLPRPVINIIKMICRSKKAALLSVPVRLVYESENVGAEIEKFNKFAEYIVKEIGLDEIDKNAVDDSVKKGSFFQHFYWDNEAVGKDGKYKGGLRCELIDPLNIFFENPCLLDEQKQQWILISSRENVESVRLKADEDADKESICGDELQDNSYSTKEQDKEQLCTVLTRYFKKDGKVYCERATKATVVNKPFAIIPDVEAARRELGYVNSTNEDAPNNSLSDDAEGESYASEELYPIVAGYYEKREKCIYGLSEVEGLIPNQKAINFNIAMYLLNSQEVSWGKYVALPNALKGQKITNAPGQVLVDYSGTGNGIKKMTEQAIHSSSLDAVNMLTNLTRSVSGATEIMTGEMVSSTMSGAAIAQLQAQAQTPIEELRNTFWLAKKKQGEVLAQFYRNFYEQKTFNYEKTLESGEKQKTIEKFSSREFKKTSFSVVVEATQGTRSSVAADINMLDNLLKGGAINVEAYVEAYPDSAIGNKSKILEILKNKQSSELETARAQIEQLQGQMKEMAKLTEQLTDVANRIMPVIKENNSLKVMCAELAADRQEAIARINQANRQITEQNKAMERVFNDAQALSQGYLNVTEQNKIPNV
ncbi:MAG: hypothetical protein IJW54_06270 [Clostridia bacterium]|nr:hypothetical protein [Clostridia bacterium]